MKWICTSFTLLFFLQLNINKLSSKFHLLRWFKFDWRINLQNNDMRKKKKILWSEWWWEIFWCKCFLFSLRFRMKIKWECYEKVIMSFWINVQFKGHKCGPNMCGHEFEIKSFDWNLVSVFVECIIVTDTKFFDFCSMLKVFSLPHVWRLRFTTKAIVALVCFRMLHSGFFWINVRYSVMRLVSFLGPNRCHLYSGIDWLPHLCTTKILCKIVHFK